MKRVFSTLLLSLIITFAYAQKAKYVFYFIGDGMGVNQVNGTEMYYAEKDGKIGTQKLLFTQFPFVTMATTFSFTNSVTDSSASGTALATGHKTYNGAIGVDHNKEAISSVAVAAKKAGRKVGITTSVSVDHATPAAFYAHQPKRSMYYEIATDLPKANFDFYAGSGFVEPNKDGKENVFSLFDKAGYVVAKGYNDFKSKEKSADKMILIQEDGKDAHSLPYAIDRKADDLTLTQITESALSFLTKKNRKGFFLMVEGGKIDWACHSNDAATVFHEVKDMNNALQVAFDFYKKHPKETLIVVTADHETGGLSLGCGPYALNLQSLQYQMGSVDALSADIKALRVNKNHNVSWEDVKGLLAKKLGFWKSLELNWEQEKLLRDEYENSFVKHNVKFSKNLYAESEPLAAKAVKVANDIAMLVWASGGHSAGYVPVYAIGAGAKYFSGKLDNTSIPKLISKAAKY